MVRVEATGRSVTSEIETGIAPHLGEPRSDEQRAPGQVGLATSAGLEGDPRAGVGDDCAVMNGEDFVRGLADAVPGIDLAEEYDYAAYSKPGEDAWATTIALADAVTWMES